ncbi:unnamed protein product, partial [Chrysoparadoxa australica]
RGKYGHEFLEVELNPDGRLRYANSSHYKGEREIIRKEAVISSSVLQELRRVVEDSEIMAEDDSNWPEPDNLGRQELEVKVGQVERECC